MRTIPRAALLSWLLSGPARGQPLRPDAYAGAPPPAPEEALRAEMEAASAWWDERRQRDHPDDRTQAALRLASIYLEEGRLHAAGHEHDVADRWLWRAEKLAGTTQGEHPDHLNATALAALEAEATARRAALRLDRGAADEALELLRSGPADPYALYLRAWAHHLEGQPERAAIAALGARLMLLGAPPERIERLLAADWPP